MYNNVQYSDNIQNARSTTVHDSHYSCLLTYLHCKTFMTQYLVVISGSSADTHHHLLVLAEVFQLGLVHGLRRSYEYIKDMKEND